MMILVSIFLTASTTMCAVVTSNKKKSLEERIDKAAKLISNIRGRVSKAHSSKNITKKK